MQGEARCWLMAAVLVSCLLSDFTVEGRSRRVRKERKPLIMAPVEYLNEDDRILTQKSMGPSAWVCAPYDEEQPWLAYDVLEDYIWGANSLDENLERTTWPQSKSYPQNDDAKEANPGKICHYLEKKYHCDIPVPDDGTMLTYTKMPPIIMWANDFWGQASDRRVEYVIDQMMDKFDELDMLEDVNLDVCYVNYFPDNLKSVTFDVVE